MTNAAMINQHDNPETTAPLLRQAQRADIPGMHRVRLAVRENRLTSSAVTEAHYVPEIEVTGRGWVVETDGVIVGFSIGNSETGNIWALFVDPDHAGKGLGRKLHDAMVQWLFACGVQRLSLSTQANTRADRFYHTAGWLSTGLLANGDASFERFNPNKA